MTTTYPLKMTVNRLSDALSVIHIEGDVTAAAEDKLMDAYAEASQNGTKGIILDFERLEFMNSSGIGLLVTLLIRAKRHEQKLMAVGLDEHYKTIFELTRLNEAIVILDTVESARVAV